MEGMCKTDNGRFVRIIEEILDGVVSRFGDSVAGEAFIEELKQELRRRLPQETSTLPVKP